MTIENCKENETHYKIKLCPAQSCSKKGLFNDTSIKDTGYVIDKKNPKLHECLAIYLS